MALCETLADEPAFAWVCCLQPFPKHGKVFGRQRVAAMRLWCLCRGFWCAVARARRVVVRACAGRGLAQNFGSCPGLLCGRLVRCSVEVWSLLGLSSGHRASNVACPPPCCIDMFDAFARCHVLDSKRRVGLMPGLRFEAR